MKTGEKISKLLVFIHAVVRTLYYAFCRKKKDEKKA